MSLTIGSTAGDYQVVEILGAGGMGQVYKVRNVISDRIDAMKVLLPDLVNEPELADRFVREIKIQAGLDHPNIAQQRTAMRVENQLLMVMEYVEGETLDQRLAAGPLPPKVAVDYILQSLSALEYAHARGVVHRDVKPANMIVTAAGVLKLMDFGIAKVATDHHLTSAGTTLGSLYYMSPEQIQGATNLDGRSDLYSTGVALYELVTGKRPFDGGSQYSIMQAHLTSSPAPPIEVDPKLPASLNDLILVAVRRDAGQRFQTAAAFRKALETVAAELAERPAKPIAVAAAPPVNAVRSADVPSAVDHTERQRSRRLLWLAAGSVAAVLAMVAVIQFGPRKATTASPTPAPAQPPATAPVVAAPQPEPQPPAEPPPAPVAQQEKPGPPAKSEQPSAPKSPPAGAVKSVRTPATVPDVPAAVSAPASPPAQVAAPPVTQTAPPRPQPPVVRGPSAEELQQTREHLSMLSVRGSGIRTSLDALQRSQGASGRSLRGDMQEAATLMTTFLEGAVNALNAGDTAQAKNFADKAERQIEKLEKFLNR